MAYTVDVQIPHLDKKITIPTGLFIDNEFVPSIDSSERITYVHVLCKVISPMLNTGLSILRRRKLFVLLSLVMQHFEREASRY